MEIQKRVVYNILMMFGDVGGLYDFFGLFFATIFGLISQNLLLARMVEKLFHITTEETHAYSSNAQSQKPYEALKSIK